MRDARETLMAAGVPLGGPRAASVVIGDGRELEAALDAAEARLDADERVAVAAWLAAFAHHWPARFEAVFGPAGHVRLAASRRAVIDRNRYLKLRRIAIENLASAS